MPNSSQVIQLPRSSSSTPKAIVVVGSINTDLVATTPRLPRPGETITGSCFATFQGGKGANQAVAAAQLGATVTLIGKVGSDAFGSTSIHALQSRGVQCDHVAQEPGDSGVAVITVDASGQNSIVVIPGSNAHVTPEFVESKRSVIREAAIVLAQLEIPLGTVLRLARICREERVPFMLDPAPAIALPPSSSLSATGSPPTRPKRPSTPRPHSFHPRRRRPPSTPSASKTSCSNSANAEPTSTAPRSPPIRSPPSR